MVALGEMKAFVRSGDWESEFASVRLGIGDGGPSQRVRVTEGTIELEKGCHCVTAFDS